jgi:hypothetical protein
MDRSIQGTDIGQVSGLTEPIVVDNSSSEIKEGHIRRLL